jgi:hypothetical protein
MYHTIECTIPEKIKLQKSYGQLSDPIGGNLFSYICFVFLQGTLE